MVASQLEEETCGWCVDKTQKRERRSKDLLWSMWTTSCCLVVWPQRHSRRETWETSEPTWVGEAEPVRYCGMEVSRTEHGDFFANQCSYSREVVRRHGVEDLNSAQLMKEAQEPEDELDGIPAQVREAQQLGCELLWLATKTRPDIAYVVSRICSATRMCDHHVGWSASGMEELQTAISSTLDGRS